MVLLLPLVLTMKKEAKSKGGFRLTNFGYFEPGKRDANADAGFRLTNFGYFEPGKRDANAERF